MTQPLEADAILNGLDAPASIARLHGRLRAVDGEGDAPEWDEPIALDGLAPLPDFPVEVFPKPIEEMVRGVATEMQVPLDLPGGLVLAALATGAGGRAEVHVRGRWYEPLNIHIAIAAAPGTGKSPVFNEIMKPVLAAERQLQDQVRPKIKELETERRRAKARAEAARQKGRSPEELETAADALQRAEEMDIPVLPRLTADDITPEAAASMLVEQGGRLAILSAEGGYYENVLGRYSNGRPNLELVLKGHAGDRLQVDRRDRQEAVERPALTVGVCMQPQMLQDLAGSKQMQGRGALARLLFSLPPDMVGYRDVYSTPTLDEGVRRTYGDIMKDLIADLAALPRPEVIELSPDAERAHADWRAEIEPRLRRGTGDLESLREWASKLAGHTARLAGLLHLAEHRMSGLRKAISQDTMNKAIRLSRYFVDHALAAFGVMRANPLREDALAVLGWITKGRRTEFTSREVHRGHQRRFDTAEEVTRVLSMLEGFGYLRAIETPSTGGRKSLRYVVNPLILDDTVTEAS
ncbi:YfjI family protein [Nonomuraea endophytica]|uniref:YfjI family protein n=1 Tax=Nonomuraea endophytica TaxID=714136 RepID=UPI0037C89FA0